MYEHAIERRGWDLATDGVGLAAADRAFSQFSAAIN